MIPGSGRFPGEEWLPTAVFLPGESHGQRSLVGCSPWGCKESDTTEQLTLSLIRWPLDRSPSLLSPYPPAPHQPPWLPGSKIKQTFLSTNLASLLVFEQQAAKPHFQLYCHSPAMTPNSWRASAYTISSSVPQGPCPT